MERLKAASIDWGPGGAPGDWKMTRPVRRPMERFKAASIDCGRGGGVCALARVCSLQRRQHAVRAALGTGGSRCGRRAVRALAGVLLAMAAEAAQQLRDVDLVAPRLPAGDEADRARGTGGVRCGRVGALARVCSLPATRPIERPDAGLDRGPVKPVGEGS